MVMRSLASPRFKKTLELARNFVNITFPPEFGMPLLLRTPEGMAAMFPDHVRMRAFIGDRPVSIHPIGEGYTADEAMIDLFSLYAKHDSYEDILVHDALSGLDRKFRAYDSPFATVIFQRQRMTGNSHTT